jgi:hypothetical protein
MSEIKNYLDRKKVEGEIAHIMVNVKVHKEVDCWDAKLFYEWLRMAIKEGPERITIKNGEEPDTWVVKVTDKKE